MHIIHMSIYTHTYKYLHAPYLKTIQATDHLSEDENDIQRMTEEEYRYVYP